jgi:hypothetical protein
MTTINWQKVKEYYTEQKIKKSKEHKLRKPIYIMDEKLEPPYSVEELDKVLQEKGTIIPDPLYKYLTLVSREIIVSYYPVLFKLNNLPTKSQQEKVSLKDTMYEFTIDDDLDCNKYENYKKDDIIDGDDFDAVMIEIGYGGCTDIDYLYLGDGIHYGSIWNTNLNDWIYKMEKSFDEYITKYIKDKENYIL